MIKLIVTDIDGTLLPEGTHTLEPDYFDVIRRLRDKGMQFAAASGRHWKSIDQLFGPVREKIFYVADNGAYLGTCSRSLIVHTLPKETAVDIIREVRQMEDVEIAVSCANWTYMETSGTECWKWLEEGYRYDLRLIDDLTQVDEGEGILKLPLDCTRKVDAIAADFRKKYGDKAKMAVSGEKWLDIVPVGVNKATAVRELQESLGISPEETIAFGDQLNDLEMLERAYYSFAVGNAREEVKQAARFQADTNERNGVLKILKTLL